jgi:putative ATP-dependent endonuclease of OLD family
MYISKVSLVNYRNFRNANLFLKKGINTIIGENGSGKTNVFRAIRLLLDDELLKFSYKLSQDDFSRDLGDWKGHWIIISLEFSELSADESIQSLFVHGLSNPTENIVDKATYNLFFRPKAEFRQKLSELERGNMAGLQVILDTLTIEDYETVFTGKSTADFTDPVIYKDLVGDFGDVAFNSSIDHSLYGTRIPHQLSISSDINFTFIKALRDVVGDFNNNRTNPLLSLLRHKSSQIDEAEYAPISASVKKLNEDIEKLSDVREITTNIKETIKETVGETYAPSSLSIKSGLPDEADKLLQSLRLYIGEPDEDHEGAIHELSLGGANLIFLTLKLLEFKYQRTTETFANFLLIEEPEAHLHTHVQKTLFDRIDYGDTQIIYSTHSTFISESSNIENVNILSKQRNRAEVFLPSNGLSKTAVTKLQRYLDAVRTNLLFAKGVILVEGDAEEILIPLLVKRIFGLSLDELGISLINIGSTGFENVGQIFHTDRIRRRCSIITDLDQAICDTTEITTDSPAVAKYKKRVARSAKSGRERKVLMDAFVAGNEWVRPFRADYTFEIDFINSGNEEEILSTVSEVYKDQRTIDEANAEIKDEDLDVYGKRLLDMAKYAGKGWFAIILGGFVDCRTIMPEYILDAIVFAKNTLSRETVIDIIKHRVACCMATQPSIDISTLKELFKAYKAGTSTLQQLIDYLDILVPDDQILILLKKL